MPVKLDQTDKAILNTIQENSRITIKEMAQQLNLSTTPIFERLKRLEKEAVIQKYVAIVDAKKIGKKLKVFVSISIVDHSKDAIEKFVKQIDTYSEVIECHHITGDSDFLLKVIVEDIEAYNTFITDKLSVVPNIGNVTSSFALSTRKHTTAMRIET